jgi:nitronate monooxygenase
MLDGKGAQVVADRVVVPRRPARAARDPAQQLLQPCAGAILPGMLRTAFTELVGCQVPIQMAPMGGGVVTPELAIAVARGGGLGMLQRADPTTSLADRIGRLEQAQAGPFGVNFVLHTPSPSDRAEIELAASRARLVEFFWADPDPALVELVHAGGALAGWQVGSVQEAERAADAGCDLVIAQGMEAGGHVRGTVALLPLLAGVLEVVTVPVLAAGGIAGARSMAAVLGAGAAGVRVRTRFLATPESGAHPEYVAALVAADGEATVLTEASAGRTRPTGCCARRSRRPKRSRARWLGCSTPARGPSRCRGCRPARPAGRSPARSRPWPCMPVRASARSPRSPRRRRSSPNSPREQRSCYGAEPSWHGVTAGWPSMPTVWSSCRRAVRRFCSCPSGSLVSLRRRTQPRAPAGLVGRAPTISSWSPRGSIVSAARP